MVSIVLIGVEGAALGLVATLAMDLLMARLGEGTTAPRVAASVLTGVRPEDVTDTRANVVHYAAGIASGILFVALLTALWSVLGVDSWTGSLSLLAVAGSAGILFAWLVGFFSVIVLPQYDAGLSRQRLSRIRRDWAVAAAIPVVVLVVLWLAVVTIG